MDKLNKIQTELVATKDKYNSFGKYHYRSAEGILESLKPLLKKYECTLVINDDMIMLGDRFYVKATATISDGTTNVSASAFAREPENKKGQDESQITGSASSYARKYALNGLFAIDDTKDADATNTHGKSAPEPVRMTNDDLKQFMEVMTSDGLFDFVTEEEKDALKHARDFDLAKKIKDNAAKRKEGK
jgi:hypothetical protein